MRLQLALVVVTVIQLTSYIDDVASCGGREQDVLSQLVTAVSQVQTTISQLMDAVSQLQRDVAELKLSE